MESYEKLAENNAVLEIARSSLKLQVAHLTSQVENLTKKLQELSPVMPEAPEVLASVHVLKTEADMFEALHNGSKTAEFRKNDRAYSVGDILILHSYLNEYKVYYGKRYIIAVITHMVKGPAFGIPEDYVLLSLRIVYKSC